MTDASSPPESSLPMTRTVTADLEAAIDGRTDLALAIACASSYQADETLTVHLDDEPLVPTELADDASGRTHLLKGVSGGYLRVSYRATITGALTQSSGDDRQRLRYLHPSRYCESDRLGPFAFGEFGGLAGAELVTAVAEWVHEIVAYVPGSSRPIDGAVATLLGRAGVCRDFAHLTAAVLRANNVAARVVSVYAPGLTPMDFHAVTEAWIDGRWFVVDPTRLAPRQSLVRIASGVDATETAFLTNIGGSLTLTRLVVSAVVEPGLPYDNKAQPAFLQ